MIVPSGLESSALAEMLDALDGTAYLTDTQGRLISVGAHNWRAFAEANAASTLAAPPPVGRRIIEAISGEKVRSFYQQAHQAVMAGGRRIAFTFRCDAPDVERRMKMSISPLRLRKEVVGVLYQSTILYERVRPPLRFLETSAALKQYMEDQAPLIASCSFCAKIAWPPGSNGPWIEPEAYYRAGGVSEVRLSHGMCPACAEDMPAMLS